MSGGQLRILAGAGDAVVLAGSAAKWKWLASGGPEASADDITWSEETFPPHTGYPMPARGADGPEVRSTARFADTHGGFGQSAGTPGVSAGVVSGQGQEGVSGSVRAPAQATQSTVERRGKRSRPGHVLRSGIAQPADSGNAAQEVGCGPFQLSAVQGARWEDHP